MHRSLLTFRTHPGMREQAVRTVVRRRVLEECAEAIPGFLGGELALSPEDPDVICVTALWACEASYLQWLASPVRAAQGPDLAPFLAQAPVAALFGIAHTCPAAAGGTAPEAP